MVCSGIQYFILPVFFLFVFDLFNLGFILCFTEIHTLCKETTKELYKFTDNFMCDLVPHFDVRVDGDVGGERETKRSASFDGVD